MGSIARYRDGPVWAGLRPAVSSRPCSRRVLDPASQEIILRLAWGPSLNFAPRAPVAMRKVILHESRSSGRASSAPICGFKQTCRWAWGSSFRFSSVSLVPRAALDRTCQRDGGGRRDRRGACGRAASAGADTGAADAGEDDAHAAEKKRQEPQLEEG